MRVKLCRKVREALDATGLPWEITEGTKHHHVRMAGRLVAILPKGGKGRANQAGPQEKKVLCDIRRVAKEVGNDR